MKNFFSVQRISLQGSVEGSALKFWQSTSVNGGTLVLKL